MYAFIEGTVASLSEQYVVVKTGGVGYQIFATSRMLGGLKKGDPVMVYTSLIVKEDEMSLYGFVDVAEKTMFEKLIGISGVGPKAAMSVLSTMSANEIASAVFAGDVKAFSRANGIGAKTAGRIVLELKDRVSLADLDGVAFDPDQMERMQAGPLAEATEALMRLGYSRSEATQAAAQVKDLGDTAEDLILLALKQLNR